MKISREFNRLYHSVIAEFGKLEYAIIDIEGSDFELRPSCLSLSTLKALLKQLDMQYPKDMEHLALSITVLDSKEMSLHVEWMINTIYKNGGTVHVVEEEFKRIIGEEQ